jgi:precorrin-2 dehydrogenase/sirohydrochlorin ferrochelatase
MLDLRGRLAIVVGGNAMAAEKAANLAASGAHVRVIHPKFCDELLELERLGQVTLTAKVYEPGDLAGAFVVVAVTTNEQRIEAIWQETQERNQPVNIADVPRYCTFILPSILRRGQLTVAVSTEGASPSLAKRLRQQLEDIFPQTYEAYIQLAALARKYLRQYGVAYDARDEFFRQFMDAPILQLLDEGDVPCALAYVSELLHGYKIAVSLRELREIWSKDHVVTEMS